MPITPPDPGKTRDTLRAALADLEAYAACRPSSVLARLAVEAVRLAVITVTELAEEASRS